jgi:hypothetical protein
MKVVAEIGNTTYYETKAVELIYSSHQLEQKPSEQEAMIRQAVGLLLLSLVKRGQDSQSVQEGSKDSGGNGETPTAG